MFNSYYALLLFNILKLWCTLPSLCDLALSVPSILDGDFLPSVAW